MLNRAHHPHEKRYLLPDLGSDEHTSEGSSCSKRSRRDQSEGKLSSQDRPVARNPSRKLQSKALQKRPTPRKPDSKKMMKELCTKWNVSAWVGKVSETRRGWLKKGQWKRDAQNKLLRRMRPGTKALQEIRHYQRCQTFLIAMGPFQHLVRELCENSDVWRELLRWQSNALFHTTEFDGIVHVRFL